VESVRTTGVDVRSGQDTSAGIRDSSRDAVRWTVAEGDTPLVLGPDAPDWLNLDRDPRAQLVKSNPRRDIHRFTSGERTLYVKSYRVPTLRDRLRNLFLGSPGRREWRAARAAATRNVPCPRYIAWGKAAGREWLVSEAITGGVLLSDAWRWAVSITQAAERKRSTDAILEAVAILLAGAHQAGFVHGDDHPRNVLITEGAGGERRAYYLDLVGVRFCQRVSRRGTIRSLAQLHQWFRWRATRTQRLRFLCRYVERKSENDLGSSQFVSRSLVNDILKEAHLQSARLWKKRDARIGRDNNYFARLRPRPGVSAWIALRPERDDRDDNESSERRNVAEWEHLLVDVLDKPDASPPEFVQHVERYAGPPPSPGRILNGTQLGRRFVLAHRLRHRDVPCRCPHALLAVATPSRSTDVRLWLDTLPRTVDLITFARESDFDRRKRRRVIASLARLVTRMADVGASFRRAFPDTFAVEIESGRVIIDDPTGIELSRRDVARHRAEVFRALHDLLAPLGLATRTDQARFLRAIDVRHWRNLWRQSAAEDYPT